jgi:hypothetical protein
MGNFALSNTTTIKQYHGAKGSADRLNGFSSHENRLKICLILPSSGNLVDSLIWYNQYLCMVVLRDTEKIVVFWRASKMY